MLTALVMTVFVSAQVMPLPAPDPVVGDSAPISTVAKGTPEVEGGGCFSMHLPVMTTDLEPEVEENFWYIYVTHILLGDTCGPFWIAPLWVGYWPEDYVWDAAVTWLLHMWMYPLSYVCGPCFVVPFAVNKLWLFPVSAINTYNYHLKLAKAQGKDTRPMHEQKAEALEKQQADAAAKDAAHQAEMKAAREARDKKIIEDRERKAAEELAKKHAAEAAAAEKARIEAEQKAAADAEAQRQADVDEHGLPKASPDVKMDGPDAVAPPSDTGGTESPRTPHDHFAY